MHYRLLEFFITSMRSYQKTGTYKVMPMHCKVPNMSEQGKTIISATELIEALRETAPSAATDKSRHATTIADLTAIITDSPSQRVRLRQSARVDNQIATTTPAPRVTGRATTATNLTSPRVAKATQYVHQRTTRNNTPIPPPIACHALYQTPRNTALISQKALCKLVDETMCHAKEHFTPQCLQDANVCNTPTPLEEVTNGVVHPDTK